jgi:hypothetical protein
MNATSGPEAIKYLFITRVVLNYCPEAITYLIITRVILNYCPEAIKYVTDYNESCIELLPRSNKICD